MTRVLLWKELRDQATVLAALIALGSAILVAVAVLVEPAEGAYSGRMRAFSGSGGMGLIMLLLAAGVVVGGSLFAGEAESGTFGFLDRLPSSRWRIWWRKVLAGAGLVGIAASVLIAVAFASGAVEAGIFVLWLIVGFTLAFSAFAWGVLGSVLTKSSLAACGLGLGLGTGTSLMIAASFNFVFAMSREHSTYLQRSNDQLSQLPIVLLGTFWTILIVPLPIAAWLFTATDRSRSPTFEAVRIPGLRGRTVRIPQLGWGGGGRRLAWLVVRQTSSAAAVLSAIALILGSTMLIPAVQPIVVFPLIAFAAGVFVALVGMGDEQQSNAGQFWGERRLPVGQLWFAKVAAGLGLSLALAIAMLIPLVFGHVLGRESNGPFMPSLFRTALIQERGFPIASFFLLWPVYGFSFTHLAAVLFRKAIVAAAVGGMVGGTFAAFWFPSVLGGGLHLWQVLVPPLAVLIVARVVMWSWATNRLGNAGPLARLSGGLAAVAVLGTGCLAYRVLEVPSIPQAEDHEQFARQLPTFDEKQSGRDLRRASALYLELPMDVRSEVAERPLTKRKSSITDHTRTFSNHSYEVLGEGYPTDRPDYDEWLGRMFASKWDDSFVEAAKKPIGVLEDVNEMSVSTTVRPMANMRDMTLLLLIRGLERQLRGQPKKFVEALELVLSAVRTTGHQSTLGPTLTAIAIEQTVYSALDRWLERLEGRPELLARALQLVREHEANDTFDPQSVRLAQQVFLANAIGVPGQWMPQYLDDMRPGTTHRRGIVSAEGEVEGNLITFAWAVPWERARHRRIVGLGNVAGGSLEQQQYFRGTPGLEMASWDNDRALATVEEQRPFFLTRRRAAVLKLAIRQFELREGRVPRKLEELVPKYLPTLPEDPYSKSNFGYRISAGEAIPGLQEDGDSSPDHPPGASLIPEEYLVFAGAFGGTVCWPLLPEWQQMERAPGPQGGVPIDWERLRKPVEWDAKTGQPILWSVGPDRVDDHGRIANPRPTAGHRGGDLVYVVPRRP